MREIKAKMQNTEITHNEKEISVSAPAINIENNSEINTVSETHSRKPE